MGRRFLFAIGVLSCCFISVFGQSAIARHEYWIDDDYENRVVVKTTSGSRIYTVKLNNLPSGVHYFNHRTQNANGEWGAMTRNVFYLRDTDEELAESVAPVVGYEYWVDDDYENKVFVSSDNESNAFEISTVGLAEGTHCLNFRSCNADGKWGALASSEFYLRASDEELSEELSPLAGYEFWLDDDYENKVYKRSTSANPVASMSLKNAKAGVHYFNFRSHNKAGKWGAASRNIFYLQEEGLASDEGSSIIGYKYSFNELTKYVGIEPCAEYSLTDSEIAMPEFKEFASLDDGCSFEFNESSVVLNRDNTAVFSMQFENENHQWSTPALSEINVQERLEKPTIEMPLQKKVAFEKVAAGDFIAIKIDIEDTNYFVFKATQPCRIDLYDSDGELYETLTEEQLLEATEIGLFDGVYYGIVRDHKTDDVYNSNSVYLQMYASDDPPMPEFYIYNGNSNVIFKQNLAEAEVAASAANSIVFAENVDDALPANFVAEGIASEMMLFDAQPFYCPENVVADNLTYTRNFTSNNWQALYIPFAMAYEDWADKADVAYINNVHQWDDDNDGEIDRTVLEFITKKSGSIEANKPYVIRPKQTGEVTFTSENTTLYAAPETDGFVDCRSTTTEYTLYGTYQEKTDMYAKGYYAMADGGFKQAESASVTLAPFRTYLKIESRTGAGTVQQAKRINIMVDGVMDNDATGIGEIAQDSSLETQDCYSLSGQKVGRGYKGIVIKNGKKLMTR